MTFALDRRNFLRLTGLGASSLFLPSLSNAQAPEPTQKRRVLFIYAEGGWTNRFIQMRPPGAPPEWSRYNPYHPDFSLVPDELEWEFSLADSGLTENDFSRVLKPLFPPSRPDDRHRGPGDAEHRDRSLRRRPCEGPHRVHVRHRVRGRVRRREIARRHAVDGSAHQRVHPHHEPDHRSLDFRTLTADLFHDFVYRSDGNGGAVRFRSRPIQRRRSAGCFRRRRPGPEPARLGRPLAFAAAKKQYDRIARGSRAPIGSSSRATARCFRPSIASSGAASAARPRCGPRTARPCRAPNAWSRTSRPSPTWSPRRSPAA